VAQDASSRQRSTGEGAEAGGAPPRVRGVATRETGAKWQWLFLVPFFGTFLPWIYNTQDPELFGMPFFYWYQIVWLPISVIVTIIVYLKTRGRA
jgi:apolipoprotein N-acyltransferase